MQRVGLINGNNIIYDHDLTAGLLASLSSGVIEGFGINSENILPGKALIECYRSNGQKILVNFESTSNEAFDLTGTKCIYIQIDQAKIDNGSNNNEDGSGIGSIISSSSFPVTQYNWIPLYSIVDGVVTDERIPVKSKLARTGLTPYRLCISDQDGNETFLEFGENGQSLVSGGPETLPSWISPTVNIVGLTETNLIKNDDEFILSRGGINQKIKSQNLGLMNINVGDGSDGDITISSGTTTLARDMYYNNLTVSSPGVLNTNGYKIFVKGTLSGNGTIAHNGNNGNNGSAGIYIGSQLAGAVALNTGTTGVKGAGGYSGGSSTSGAYTGESTSGIGTYFDNGKAGDGGTATGNISGTVTANGGVGGTKSVSAKLSISLQDIVTMLTNFPFGNISYTTYSQLNISIGGAGGGGVRGTYNAQAGSGGGGGGCVYIISNVFDFTGSLEAKGGNGGNGATGANSSSGGGGGGTGGVIYIKYLTKIGSYTYNVTGGSAGTPLTTATAGSNGKVIENDIIII